MNKKLLQSVTSLVIAILICLGCLWGCSQAKSPQKSDNGTTENPPEQTPSSNPDVDDEEDTPVHIHSFDSGAVTKEATCKEAGILTYTCSCGETKTEEIKKLATHSFDSGKVDGNIKTYTCTLCGSTKTEDISKPHVHEYDSGRVTKAATCKEAGVLTYTCTCGDTKTEEIKKLDTHSFDSGKVTKAATCKETGVLTYTCTVCQSTETEEIKKTDEHKYDGGVISGAVKLYTCTLCGHTKTETVEIPDITADKKEFSIVYWGDATLSANSMGDILAALGASDGIKINSFARVYDNIEDTTTYNLYETCDIEGSTKATIQSTAQNLRQIEALKDADYFIILSGRDRSLAESNKTKTRLALKAWYDKYKEVNPDGQLVLYVPQAFNGARTSPIWQRLSGVLSYMTRTVHNKTIKNAAQELAEYIGNDCILVQIGDAYNTFMANNTDIDLYDDNSNRFSSIAGSYYSACVLYSTIFSKSTDGMSISHPTLDADTMNLLQKASDDFLSGTGKALIVHTAGKELNSTFPNMPESDTDSRFANEVYSKNYDVIMSTLLAYDMRTSWVQYDNMNFDRVTKSWNRRDAVSSPESGTPQSILYTDCSAFIAAAFRDTFGFTFDGANRVNQLIKKTQYQEFFWAEKSSTSASQAISEFMNTLRPGDVFVYTNYDAIGHTAVYVGGGWVIHSIGSSATGGGENYYFDADSDAWEYTGGIIWTHIDEFTDPNGRFYMFKDNLNDSRDGVEVAILRPLDYVGNPTQNALNRMNNMQGILSYKHTTAPEGITVSSGSEVTFTFVLENLNNVSKTLSITDTLPSGVTYVSGNGSFSGGKFTASVTLAPGERKEVSYTVKVTASNGTTVKMNNAYIGGVRTNSTDIAVAKTLSTSQQTTLLSKLKDGTAGSGSYAIISAAYKEIGITLPDLQSEIDKIFKLNTSGSEAYTQRVTGSNTSKMLAGNMYGGRNNVYSAASGVAYPIKNISCKNLIVGDIIVYNEDGKADGSSVYVYVGDGILATYRNGALDYLSAANSLKITESLMGKFNWFVLRPSLA